ncbi:TetR/AcrR family transcriptional regulator [Mycolicibacterium fallax]|uniref:TetR family transcriptional regulator n=1 Tax=Mycolicibacterium fallax TaxID=1793 RepID=A0A1X1RI53_MYCFA|nr:TetR family transcriptional regulator [Mycolicibacterium fallax]BBY96724.1 TetR family transcriptional regulator [Mycolicibacterium fallax]
MATVNAEPMPTVKRRPKDRKAQIARASAEAFSALGYHAVSMGDIAARVGISAAALYRHSASKYQLFRDAVIALGEQLVNQTAFADDAPGDTDAAELLDRVIRALIDTSIANRTSGGLYRWEGRYLNDEDQAVLMGQINLVNRRLQRPLARLRPELDSWQRWTLSSAALSVIGSIADHRARLPVAEIRELLRELTHAALAVELPTIAEDGEAPDLGTPVAAGRYEALLTAAMRLFSVRHYHETSMEDIAAEVGMPVSGIYRYFAGKADLLAASFRRAADRVSGDLANVLAAQTDPELALRELIDAYVARSFDDPELAFVYYTEWGNLPVADRAILHNVQVATVQAWAALVVAARPELPPERARFAVHAAFALVVDLGRLVGYDNTEQSRARVRVLMAAVLLGDPGR